MNLYTDTVYMSDGETKIEHHSAISRLYAADKPILLYLQLAFAAISIISSILILFGFKNRMIRTVRLAGTIASVIMFIIIMLFSFTVHPKY